MNVPPQSTPLHSHMAPNLGNNTEYSDVIPVNQETMGPDQYHRLPGLTDNPQGSYLGQEFDKNECSRRPFSASQASRPLPGVPHGGRRVGSVPGSGSSTSQISQIRIDTFIDELTEGRETRVQRKESDTLDAILRSQEQHRLPPLEIQRFSGKPIDWPRFIERFHDLVHEKASLTDSDRMAYLYQNLEGEAKRAVESLGVSGESYAAALKLLKEQFGNRHRVTAAHISNMIQGPDVPQGDRQALREYYYKVKGCVQWCTKIGQEAVLQTPEYVSKAAMKLPEGMRIKWYENLRGRYDDVTLRQFEDWLRYRVEALFNPFEDYIRDQAKPHRYRQPRPRPPAPNPVIHPHSVGVVTESQPVKPEVVEVPPSTSAKDSSQDEICPVCQSKHRVAYCEDFKARPFRERKKIVFDHHLCRNCLKVGHFASQCSSNGRCHKDGCALKHHTLLHWEKAQTKDTNSGSGSPPQGDTTMEVNSNQVSTQLPGCVSLQVLPVFIHSDGEIVKTLAVLDAGSDSTLIRKDLADRLGLNGDMHHVRVNTVESDTTSHNLKRVAFKMTSEDHPEPVDVDGAWVVTKLKIPKYDIAGEDVAGFWSHLEDVKLPDLGEGEVQILIGADMAHLLCHLDVRVSSPDQPVAVKTPLGWTLFGKLGRGRRDVITSNLTLTNESSSLDEKV